MSAELKSLTKLIGDNIPQDKYWGSLARKQQSLRPRLSALQAGARTGEDQMSAELERSWRIAS